MFRFEISETAVIILLAVGLYTLCGLADWALGKVERWRNKRKENRK